MSTAALISTAACSGGASESAPSDTASASATADEEAAPTREDADLVIWTSDVASRAVTPLAEQFGEENGITVAVQVIAADLAANAITANAAGNGPDVLTLPNDFLGGALQNGAVTPLPLDAEDLAVYEEGAVASVTRDGQVWALPYAMENLVLYRNTDAAPRAPATVEDLVATGRDAVGAGTVERALALPVGQEGDAYHMHPFYTSAGGTLFAVDAEGQYDPTQVGVGTRESIRAAKKIAALGEAGVLSRSIDGSNAIAQFTEGNSAYLVSGPWALADIRESGVPYDISPIPGFEGGQPAAPFLGVQAFWILSNAQNPAFAEEFVTNAINTPEAMTAMYEQDPRPPVRSDVLEQVSVEDPDMAKLAAGAENATLLPDFSFMSGVWPALGQAYAAIVGGADPATTMRQTGETIRGVVPE
jgi:arabinogalactan oligomer/maltooligosaccharide transport system substrate-binding protein